MNEADVKEMFSSAVARPAADRIDTEAVLRGGRRRQRIRVASTIGSVAAVVLVAGSLVVGGSWQLPFAPSAGPGTSATSAASALTSVTVPDPAPGFPYRLSSDSGPRQVVMDGSSYLIRQFSVSDAPKTAAGEAAGASAAIVVGTFPMPGGDGLVDGHPVTDRVAVAGTTGIVVAYEANKQPVTLLYFQKGSLAVSITGMGGATTDQLVALGSSITGLG